MNAMALSDLAPPDHTFASDNAAGVHPAVMAALDEANRGHALAYGADPWTERATAAFRDLFGLPVDVFFVWSGTGANVAALTQLVGPAGAVICPDSAHINVDETGAPERIAGCKLIDVPTADGRLRPEDVERQLHVLGVEHHAQPAVVSITQSTELGSLYAPDDVAALAAVAHRHGLHVHMDGARIANAVAALGGSPADLRSCTIDAGVDVVSFGGTKNGMMYGEAVVFLRPELAARAKFVRKLVGQLPSKMRYIAAQFHALLSDGLWLELAAHANAMAARLHAGAAAVPGIQAGPPPAVNAVFPVVPPAANAELQAWSPYYDWDVHADQVRWMCAWDTTPADVDRFLAGVREVLTPAPAG
jgi:threonine aldolase